MTTSLVPNIGAVGTLAQLSTDSNGNTVLVGADGAAVPYWVPIAQEKVSGAGVSSFTITGLAAYSKIRVHMAIATGLSSVLAGQFNGDTGANYNYSLLSYFGQNVIGSAFTTSHTEGATSMALGPAYGPGIMCTHELEFYNSSELFKRTITCRNTEITSVPQYENHTANGFWNSTAQITSIRLFNSFGFDWSPGTVLFVEGLTVPV